MVLKLLIKKDINKHNYLPKYHLIVDRPILFDFSSFNTVKITCLSLYLIMEEYELG